MTHEISVGFRFDAATPADALAVIAAIRRAGITIVPHHTHREKRDHDGVFWDGQVVVDSPAVVPDHPAPALRDRVGPVTS